MSWKKSLAHKVSIPHWAIDRGETHQVILRDPPIKELALFNPEISEELRRNEMRIEAAEFLKYLARFNLEKENDAPSHDDAFNDLVEVMTKGEEKISCTGDVADKLYRFQDEA